MTARRPRVDTTPVATPVHEPPLHCLDTLPVMAALIDTQGQCTRVSRRLADWLGCDPDLMTGQPIEARCSSATTPSSPAFRWARRCPAT